MRPESQQNAACPQDPGSPENQDAPEVPDSTTAPKEEAPEISYDRLIKTGLRAHYGDVVEWLVKERPLEVRTLEPVQDTTVERVGDKLWEARFEDKPGLILHVEWQLESDWKMMPVRMLQFASLVLELLSLEENKGKRFLGVVVYLDRKTFSGDPGGLVEELFPGKVLSYSYEVLKLWELDPEPVLESQSPGLWPFAPLMRGDPYDLLERSKQRIVGLPDKIMGLEHKQQLLTILAGLSYRVIKDWPFLQSVLSELGNMSENPVIDALLEMYGPAAIQRREEKAHREGRQEGAKAGARAALLRFLRRRFGEVGELVERRIEGIDDLETIERLAEEAAVAPTLDAFVAFLPSSSR